MKRPRSSEGGGGLAAGVLVGELLGAVIGLLESPRHVPTTIKTHYDRPVYERPVSEMDEHNDIAWPLFGGAAGAFIGAAAVGFIRRPQTRHRARR
jgi:hypothetical protein